MEKTFDITVREDVFGLGLVKGFKVGAAACDIRNKDDFTRLDLALVVSETPADAAGVFTTNDVKASPVLLDMSRLEAAPKMRAIVANSGDANACTGTRGDADRGMVRSRRHLRCADQMMPALAKCLRIIR